MNAAPRGKKYTNTTERTMAAEKRIIRVIRGLLQVAEIAMPDTYFASDRRVNAARKLLKDMGRPYKEHT